MMLIILIVVLSNDVDLFWRYIANLPTDSVTKFCVAANLFAEHPEPIYR